MLYQSFPANGMRLDFGKPPLAEMLEGESDTVYAYIMSSVVLDKGEFRQTGTGPNFQGGYITLCSCKHRMRASLSAEEWRDKWLAGFTSVKCGGRRWLFYLAKVEDAYQSQSELWHSAALPQETRQAKCARYCKLGDLYEPKSRLDSEARFDPNEYHLPTSQHSHRTHACDNNWRYDIDYCKKKLKIKPKRRPSLLVCDPKFSFLWREPLLYVDARWRHTIYGTLGAFLHGLKRR
jgi:hypothetical protein